MRLLLHDHSRRTAHRAGMLPTPGNRRVQTKIDTVIGEIGGKLLFTIYLPGGLMLAFLRERKTSATCVRVFNALWKAVGPELFLKLFPVILADIGVVKMPQTGGFQEDRHAVSHA